MNVQKILPRSPLPQDIETRSELILLYCHSRDLILTSFSFGKNVHNAALMQALEIAERYLPAETHNYTVIYLAFNLIAVRMT